MLYCIHIPISPDICSWNVDPSKSVKNRLKNSLFTLEVKKKRWNVLSVRFSQSLLILTRVNFFIFHSLSWRFALLSFTDWKNLNLNYISFKKDLIDTYFAYISDFQECKNCKNRWNNTIVTTKYKNLNISS